MQLADLTQEQLDKLLQANAEHEKDMQTLITGIMGLLQNFGVTNDDGTVPERLNMLRISKKILPVFTSKFNPFAENDLFKEMIEPLTPVYPLYEKYQHLIKH